MTSSVTASDADIGSEQHAQFLNEFLRDISNAPSRLDDDVLREHVFSLGPQQAVEEAAETMLGELRMEDPTGYPGQPIGVMIQAGSSDVNLAYRRGVHVRAKTEDEGGAAYLRWQETQDTDLVAEGKKILWNREKICRPMLVVCLARRCTGHSW